jgi:hypothetical protein
MRWQSRRQIYAALRMRGVSNSEDAFCAFVRCTTHVAKLESASETAA